MLHFCVYNTVVFGKQGVRMKGSVFLVILCVLCVHGRYIAENEAKIPNQQTPQEILKAVAIKLEKIPEILNDDDIVELDNGDVLLPSGIEINESNNFTVEEFKPFPLPNNFHAYDMNNDDGITLEELINVTGAKENGDKAFNDTDSDGDGLISESEFGRASWLEVPDSKDVILHTDNEKSSDDFKSLLRKNGNKIGHPHHRYQRHRRQQNKSRDRQ